MELKDFLYLCGQILILSGVVFLSAIPISGAIFSIVRSAVMGYYSGKKSDIGQIKPRGSNTMGNFPYHGHSDPDDRP